MNRTDTESTLDHLIRGDEHCQGAHEDKTCKELYAA